MKRKLAGAILLVCLVLSLGWFADPDMRFGVVCLWAGSALIGVNALRARGSAARSRREASANAFVRVALARPTRSPSVREAYAALPAYCFSQSR